MCFADGLPCAVENGEAVHDDISAAISPEVVIDLSLSQHALSEERMAPPVGVLPKRKNAKRMDSTVNAYFIKSIVAWSSRKGKYYR